MWATWAKGEIPRGGGVLRYISDGDVRSPFWGLKFCSDFFWVRDFGKEILGVDKKRNPGFSFLFQTIVPVSFTVGRFLGQGLGEGLFWGLTISPHSHIPITNIPEYPPGGDHA